MSTKLIHPPLRQINEVRKVTGASVSAASRYALRSNAITELRAIAKSSDSIHVSDLAEILETLLSEAVI